MDRNDKRRNNYKGNGYTSHNIYMDNYDTLSNICKDIDYKLGNIYKVYCDILNNICMENWDIDCNINKDCNDKLDNTGKDSNDKLNSIYMEGSDINCNIYKGNNGTLYINSMNDLNNNMEIYGIKYNIYKDSINNLCKSNI